VKFLYGKERKTLKNITERTQDCNLGEKWLENYLILCLFREDISETMPVKLSTCRFVFLFSDEPFKLFELFAKKYPINTPNTVAKIIKIIICDAISNMFSPKIVYQL